MKIFIHLFLIFLLCCTPAFAIKTHNFNYGTLIVRIINESYSLDDILNIGIDYKKVSFDKKHELTILKQKIENISPYEDILEDVANEYINNKKSTAERLIKRGDPISKLDEINRVNEANHFIPISAIEETQNILENNISKLCSINEYKLTKTLSFITADITILFKTTNNKLEKTLRNIHVLHNGKLVFTRSSQFNGIYFAEYNNEFYFIETFYGYEGRGLNLYHIDKNGLKQVAEVYEGG